MRQLVGSEYAAPRCARQTPALLFGSRSSIEPPESSFACVARRRAASLVRPQPGARCGPVRKNTNAALCGRSRHRSERARVVDRRSRVGIAATDQASLMPFVIFVVRCSRNSSRPWRARGSFRGWAVGAPATARRSRQQPKSGLMPSTAEIFAPLNLRPLFAIRANRPQAGETGRSGAIRPAIANTSAAVARNA